MVFGVLGASAVGIALGLTGYAVPAYIAAIAAGGGLFFVSLRQPGGYSSAAAIFVAFFLAYGLIAPFGALTGAPVFLPRPYMTDIFLAHYCLACGGLALAFRVWVPRVQASSTHVSDTDLQIKALLAAALIFAGGATGFEIANVMRAGGLGTIFGSDLGHQSGKLAYQSAVTALTGTLPSVFAMRMAFALLALGVGFSILRNGRFPVKTICIFSILALPVLIGYFYLGRRTEILALILILFVAATWSRPVRQLSSRLVLGILVVYLTFVVVLILRETVLHPGHANLTHKQITDAVLYAFLPTSGEFGAPFGVFSEHIKRGLDSVLLWGRSYLDGVALMVPGFLYPGEKPVQLDVAFFQLMHAGQAGAPGGTAGYGFSPILEGYLNFGSIGVPVVFFAIGSGLCLLEWVRQRVSGVAVVLIYVMVLPLCQAFHRSTFGNAVLSPGLWIAILICMAFPIYRLAVWYFARRTQRTDVAP